MTRITNAYGANSPTLYEPDQDELRLMNALADAVRDCSDAGLNVRNLVERALRGDL
jgi:hypothetical protein